MDSVDYKSHRIYVHSYAAVDAPETFKPLAFIRGPLVSENEPEMIHPDYHCQTRDEAKSVAVQSAKAWIDLHQPGLPLRAK